MPQSESEPSPFGENGEKKKVKLKLHDKLRAIEMLNRMLGFNSPESSKLLIEDNSKTKQELEQELEELRKKRNSKK